MSNKMSDYNHIDDLYKQRAAIRQDREYLKKVKRREWGLAGFVGGAVLGIFGSAALLHTQEILDYTVNLALDNESQLETIVPVPEWAEENKTYIMLGSTVAGIYGGRRLVESIYFNKDAKYDQKLEEINDEITEAELKAREGLTSVIKDQAERIKDLEGQVDALVYVTIETEDKEDK